MRTKFVVGNWKLNGSLAGNESLLRQLLAGVSRQSGVECAVCVPAPYLRQVQGILEGTAIAWGAQDVSRYEKGAYTGEIAAPMCRVRALLPRGPLGRRTIFGDTDAVVAASTPPAAGASRSSASARRSRRKAGGPEGACGRSTLIEGGVAGLEGGIFAYEPVGDRHGGRPLRLSQEAHAFLQAHRRKGQRWRALISTEEA
jgi:triosephosphate isomerase